MVCVLYYGLAEVDLLILVDAVSALSLDRAGFPYSRRQQVKKMGTPA
jgi:hypothetical protein